MQKRQAFGWKVFGLVPQRAVRSNCKQGHADKLGNNVNKDTQKDWVTTMNEYTQTNWGTM